MTSPYLEPVGPAWARAAGWTLLAAAAAVTVYLAVALAGLLLAPPGRRGFTSSTLIFGLILLALAGICWQAGYRLAFRRPDRSGTLFSRPAWFAIGAGLVTITALMGASILRARTPTLLDLQVLLFLGGIGVWCLVLALRRARGSPDEPAAVDNGPRDSGEE